MKRALLLTATLLLIATLPSSAAAAKNYIAVFKDKVSLQKLTPPKSYTFSGIFNGALLDLNKQELRKLQGSDNLLFVSPDRRVRASAFRKTSLWNLDRIDQRSPFLNGTINTETSGRGVRIYVVDSGINAQHVDFSGRVEEGYTAVLDDLGTRDCSGHGTAVSSIAAGETYGVATDATLVPVRVLDCNAAAYTSDVLLGLEWVAQNYSPEERAVLNLSISTQHNPVLNAAVRRLVEMGIVATAAAGNSFNNACRESPASSLSALTVGASDKKQRQAWYSNWGPCVDLFAPGSAIWAADYKSPYSFSRRSGTSLSAALVSGAAALILEKRDLSPLDTGALLLRQSSKGFLRALEHRTKNRFLFVD